MNSKSKFLVHLNSAREISRNGQRLPSESAESDLEHSNLPIQKKYNRDRSRDRKPSRIHMVWASMVGRCYSPSSTSYKYYGERGIRVAARWRGDNGFRNFLSDMGDRPTSEHSLDRIDSRGDYKPGNVRWATSYEQRHNKTNNRWIEAFGERKTLADWARELGCARATILMRIRSGWPAERAVREPVRHVTKPHRRLVVAFGRTQNLSQWSREFGVPSRAIGVRLDLGWKPEKAVSETSDHRKRGLTSKRKCRRK